MFPVFPYQYRLWSVEWGRAQQSVEYQNGEYSDVLGGECNMKGMQWGFWSVKCRA